MEPKYIVAIVALSVFFILFLAFFAMLAKKRKTEAKLQAWLYEMYTDKNLGQLDYETAETEEEGTLKRDNASAINETPVAAAQESKEDAQSMREETYDKLEIEGIEEITGNYNPQ